MAAQFANERDGIFAEEAFVVDVQILLHKLMLEKGISRADLARMMNVSRPRITQIFSDECKNLTVRLLARVMYALGECPELICKDSAKTEVDLNEYKSIIDPFGSDCIRSHWSEAEAIDMSYDWAPANDNVFASLAHIRRPQPIFGIAA